MRILVTGANGQLGGAMYRKRHLVPSAEWVWTDADTLDITDNQAVNEALKNADVCINCAAYTAVDKAESDSDGAYRVNDTAVANLVEGCLAHNVFLIHISTDYVFAGKNHKPYTENDACQPLGVYGASKRAGEKRIEDVLPYFAIVRTSWLYDAAGKNFVNTMLRLAETHDELTVVDDQIGSPTYADDLAEAIMCMLQDASFLNEQEVYHFSNEGVASWYDFAQAIFELTAKEVRVKPVPSTAYPTPAPRPHFSLLSKEKIKHRFSLSISHWRQALAKCLEQKEQNGLQEH